MYNWGKNVQWQPSNFFEPSSEGEIQSIIQKAITDKKKIRIIGSGHSFTPLCATDDVSISLDNYQGIIEVDKEKCQATVKGGTKLFKLGDMLFQHGLAMENLGDIDVQSIAGTISTGTHGTGRDFGTISTQVVGLKMINGKGELITCSEEINASLFKAAQVSLGSLGVITEVTLQCVPAYRMKVENKKEDLSDVLASLSQRHKENRNFEFYWIPYTNTAWTKTSNVVDAEVSDKVGLMNYYVEYFLENYLFKGFCELATLFPSQNELVAKITAASISNVSKVHNSHKIYATQRLVRFKEMEYNIPVDVYDDVWKEVMRVVNSKKYNIHFPIENRVVKQDDILMSPAYGRDSAYIACHVYYKKDHRPYFKALEEVFRAHGGRPHWGKMNSLKAKDVVDLYPEFNTFMKHRLEQDPDEVFITPYLRSLLGL